VGRHGSPLYKSKAISRVSVGSASNKEEIKYLHCDGKVWRTSNKEMYVRDYANSSTRL
jgi:hypothetical protein